MWTGGPYGWLWLKTRLAWLLLGRDFAGVVTMLWLIRERALAAIAPDGHVVLSECRALADVLYAQTPGTWRLTIERVELSQEA